MSAEKSPKKPLTFTDRSIESFKADQKRQTFTDSKARGLTLRITPNGVKSWSFVYRVPGKNPQALHLGSFPALRLAQARGKAYELRAAVEAGRDPVGEQKAQKAQAAKPIEHAFTFEDMAKLYVSFAESTKKTWRDDEARINALLLPAWGSRPLRSITRSDVHDLLDKLVANGMGAGVNRYQALISRIFTLALDRTKVDAHPVTKMIKRVKETPRERALSDREIKDLWRSIEGNHTAAADVIRLRLLTGQRGDEIIEMRRDEVDLTKGVWTIPAASAKNGHAHIVPLSPTVKEILTRRLDAASDQLLFEGVYLQGHDLRKLAQIARNANYQWRDLRRTCATRLADLGFDETTIGRVLNHARVSVTAKHYNRHSYTAEKRKALDRWDMELSRIVNGLLNNAASVVPFHQATA